MTKEESLICLLPDDDSLEQHLKCANFLAYIQHHPNLRKLLSPIGHGWELVNSYCRPVCHTKPALPILLQVQSTQQDDSDSESESQSEFDFDTESESANDFESLDELELD